MLDLSVPVGILKYTSARFSRMRTGAVYFVFLYPVKCVLVIHLRGSMTFTYTDSLDSQS